MTTATFSTLERLRCEMGLSRAQLLAAIGARPRRDTLFEDDRNLDDALRGRAELLRKQYDQWKAQVLAQAPDCEFADCSALDAIDLAHVLGISENYARVLCQRYLTPQPNQAPWRYGGKDLEDRRWRKYLITRESVETLFEANESALSGRPFNGIEHVRGPLSAAFLRWVERFNCV